MDLEKAVDISRNISYNVIIEWHSQDGIWWNETCAKVVEIFGLPGNRYTFVPTSDNMTFMFKKEYDAMLCKMLLSERL